MCALPSLVLASVRVCLAVCVRVCICEGKDQAEGEDEDRDDDGGDDGDANAEEDKDEPENEGQGATEDIDEHDRVSPVFCLVPFCFLLSFFVCVCDVFVRAFELRCRYVEPWM